MRPLRIPFLCSDSPMKLDTKLMQRVILAFTTGLFLSCAARVSYSQSTTTSAPATSVAR